MDHFPYLFAAYAVVWTVLFAYVFSLDRRARRTEKDLEALKRSLSSRRSG